MSFGKYYIAVTSHRITGQGSGVHLWHLDMRVLFCVQADLSSINDGYMMEIHVLHCVCLRWKKVAKLSPVKEMTAHKNVI